MATVLGVLVLEEMFARTDAEALEQLEFSLLWQHALELGPDEAHLAQKTQHNFRARLLAHDRGRAAFEATTDRMLQALGTKVNRQRLDSTHVISNIAVLSRLGLMCGVDPVWWVLYHLMKRCPPCFNPAFSFLRFSKAGGLVGPIRTQATTLLPLDGPPLIPVAPSVVSD